MNFDRLSFFICHMTNLSLVNVLMRQAFEIRYDLPTNKTWERLIIMSICSLSLEM